MPIHARSEIDPTAVIADECDIGPGVVIGPNSVIETGVEMVMTAQGENDQVKIIEVQEFNLDSTEHGKASYSIKFIPSKPGNFNFGIRGYRLKLRF